MEDLQRNDRSRRQVGQKLPMLCRHVGLQYSTHAETDGQIENITPARRNVGLYAQNEA